MSLPPPPGSFGSVPPNGGGGPSWGQPQQPGQPYGAPYQGQPGGQWGPPQQWTGGPPPNKGGRGKWILIGLALVAVIAVSVVATVLVLRPDSGGGGGSAPSAQNGNSEFASANDTGPITLITEDSTCSAWNRVAKRLSDEEQRFSWGSRDKSIPASAWTPEQREMYQAVSSVMAETAKDAVGLAKQTPHRSMRELYQQYSVFADEFSNSVDSYSEVTRSLPEVVDSIASSLNNICGAVVYELAAAQMPFVRTVDPPSRTATPEESGKRFMVELSPVCEQWIASFKAFQSDTKEWAAIDSSIPASQWTPEQKAVNVAAAEVMETFADDIEKFGRASDNPVLEDIAVLSAQYRRAYAHALPSYTPNDNYLGNAAINLVRTVNSTCESVR